MVLESVCIISNALNWHLLEVKACVKGTILVQKECLVFVLWQLTVELNCIFSFRCDLDKQMFSQQISMLCQTRLCVGVFFGVQVYKMKQLLMHCPCLEVWSRMSIRWTDTWSGTKAWLWSTLNQNSDIVRLRNRSTLRTCLQLEKFFPWTACLH